jgi:AcrR family transcriptional regulator
MSKNPKKGRPDILDRVTPLFARLGYNGVSMRDLASAVGVTPAALYYHFKNKDELYTQAISRVFEQKTSAAKAVMRDEQEPSEKLETFIAWFVRTLNKDKDFRKLLQWAMLDTDPKRLKKLTKNTFQDLFGTIRNVGESFRQQYDPHLLAVSIIGLVLYHSESSVTQQKLSSDKLGKDNAETIARHITALLENGLLTH